MKKPDGYPDAETIENLKAYYADEGPSELAPSDLQAQSARCSVAVCSALRWAVFPCGWKWEIGKMTREGETPVALFEHQHHAESFCRQWWPQLGEVRSWPNAEVCHGAPEPKLKP